MFARMAATIQLLMVRNPALGVPSNGLMSLAHLADNLLIGPFVLVTIWCRKVASEHQTESAYSSTASAQAKANVSKIRIKLIWQKNSRNILSSLFCLQPLAICQSKDIKVRKLLQHNMIMLQQFAHFYVL